MVASHAWKRWCAAMLWTIIVALVVLWIIGWSFHVAGALIHVLLLLAFVLLVFNLATRGKRI
jgi:hypothetical protein